MSSNCTDESIFRAVEETLHCRAVPVPRAWFALVDAEDYEKVASRLWFLNRNGYAVCNIRDQGIHLALAMQNAILTPGHGLVVDHINHNKLDNRRSNLRICEPEQNRFNLPLRRNNTTGFKGVYHRRSKWRAQVTANGRHHYLGCFASPEEAARAYDAKAAELFGEFACLNFPG